MALWVLLQVSRSRDSLDSTTVQIPGWLFALKSQLLESPRKIIDFQFVQLFLVRLGALYLKPKIPTSFFCIWICSYISTISWKDYSCLVKSFGILVKSHLTIKSEFISGLSILFSIDLYVYPYASTTHCLDYSSFVVSVEIGKCESFKSIILPQDSLGYSGSLTFPYEF